MFGWFGESETKHFRRIWTASKFSANSAAANDRKKSFDFLFDQYGIDFHDPALSPEQLEPLLRAANNFDHKHPKNLGILVTTEVVREMGNRGINSNELMQATFEKLLATHLGVESPSSEPENAETTPLRFLIKDSDGNQIPAEEADAAAQYRIGMMWEEGKNVVQSSVQAARWFRRAAEQGHVTAQYLLGLNYAGGLGVTKDLVQSEHWFRMAAEQGDADAQAKLGIILQFGHGIPANPMEAASWYRLAAEQGNAEGQVNLGTMALNGIHVPQNTAEAVRWFNLAAEQEHASAQFNLGQICAGLVGDAGEGFANASEAVRWYRKSAEQGHSDAQAQLAIKLTLGEGVEKSETEAAHWFRLAAEQGHAEAQLQLGLRLYRGTGVEENTVDGYAWVLIADAQRHERAAEYLDLVAGSWTPEEFSAAKSKAVELMAQFGLNREG